MNFVSLTMPPSFDDLLLHSGWSINVGSPSYLTSIVPPLIRDDYFCDTGSRSKSREVYYTGDPLWDGTGCGSNSSCCSWQGPPWFCKQLPQVTRDSLELRVCTDSPSDDEQVLLELVEIYIQ